MTPFAKLGNDLGDNLWDWVGCIGVLQGPGSGKYDLNSNISTAELKYVGPRYIHMVIASYVLEVE